MYATCLKFVDFLQDYHLRGGLSQELYYKVLKQKAFYNFIVRKRYYVSRDIVQRLLIPLPQVLVLFSFIYPKAYLAELMDRFQIQGKEIGNLDAL